MSENIEKELENSKKLRVGVVVLTLNEEERIESCLQHLKPHVDYILVADGGSTDNTMVKASMLADRVVKRPPVKHWGRERNEVEALLPDDIDWVLHCDADEQPHDRLLPEIRMIISKMVERYPAIVCFRFPRANLPKCEDYPSYQIRLMRRGTGYTWSYHVHEKPTVDGVDVDRLEGKCFTMLDLPIWHLPRRTDIERPWWSDEPNKRDKTREELKNNYE